MAEEEFHVVMFPWFAMGHIIPYIHLANKLAERGLRITILLPQNTLLNLQHQNLHPNLLSFHSLAVPHVEGLPPGTETVSDVPFSDHHLVAVAMDLMRQQVEEILNAIKPNLVLFDFAHWIPDISKQLGFKSVKYFVVSATANSFALGPSRKIPKGRPMTEEELKEIPSGYPSSIVLPRGFYELSSLNGILMPFGLGNISFYDRLTTAMRNCDALAIRTCREVEGKYCDYIGTQYGKSVLLTGTALPEPDKTQLEDRWDKWLSWFERGSVVSCVFGTQYILQKDQFQELVLGFELTGLPFFVSVKPPVGCATMEEALPEGFAERVKGRGVVYGGWVQQPQILNHPSVGCFVNHCGFGSMWEGLMSDDQLVLVPNLGDQIMNTRLLVEELKVAVEVEKDENGWFSKESLSRAIKCVMDKDSEVGIMVRKNHTKLKQELAKPGLIDRYVDEFAQSLQELVKPS